MLSLWHRKFEPPGKAKPVFSKKQVGELAPLLVKAFRKVKLNKYLHFEYRSPKGLTEGDVFASLDKLHWRLLKINGVIYSNDPLKIRKPTWKLVKIKGQKFHKTTTATATDKKPQENLIIANLK